MRVMSKSKASQEPIGPTNACTLGSLAKWCAVSSLVMADRTPLTGMGEATKLLLMRPLSVRNLHRLPGRLDEVMSSDA
jgi:hypothetical protein